MTTYTHYAIFDIGPGAMPQWIGAAATANDAVRKFFAEVYLAKEEEYTYEVVALTQEEAHTLEIWVESGAAADEVPDLSGFKISFSKEAVWAALGVTPPPTPSKYYSGEED